MEKARKILNKLNYIPELKAGAGSPPTSTGPHEVIVLEDEPMVVTGHDFKTDEPREEFKMFIEENGVKKFYQIPILDATGDPDYRFVAIAEAEPGDKLHIEMKKKKNSEGNYTEIVNVSKGENQSSYLHNEEGAGNTAGDSEAEGGSDILGEDYSKLPF